MESPAEEAPPRVDKDCGLDIEGVPVIMRAYGVVGGLRTGSVEDTSGPKLVSRS